MFQASDWITTDWDVCRCHKFREQTCAHMCKQEIRARTCSLFLWSSCEILISLLIKVNAAALFLLKSLFFRTFYLLKLAIKSTDERRETFLVENFFFLLPNAAEHKFSPIRRHKFVPHFSRSQFYRTNSFCTLALSLFSVMQWPEFFTLLQIRLSHPKHRGLSLVSALERDKSKAIECR